MLEQHDLMELVIGNEKQPDPTTSAQGGVEVGANAVLSNPGNSETILPDYSLLYPPPTINNNDRSSTVRLLLRCGLG